MKLFFLFLSFYIVSIDLESNETNTDECISKKLQIMMPEYPYTTYQGYALVNFDVNEEGNLKNISAVESKCAVSRLSLIHI